MLKSGILNPQLNSLLCRVRHTNTLVIADRGFPYWPHIETVDLSLVDDIPRVMDVLAAIKENFSIGRVFAAEEFLAVNAPPGTSLQMVVNATDPGTKSAARPVARTLTVR